MLLHELPADILIVFLCRYDLKDILKLEQTCRTIRDIVSTRQVWLAQLRRLDQTHAPNLPIHVDVLTLELNELREIVTTAVRAYDNCLNGTFGRTAHKTNHEISIKLNPPDSGSGICNATLVPGRNFLFASWSSGHVQLVNPTTRKAVWTHPEEDKARSLDGSLLKLTSFDELYGYGVDFRTDGSASIICYFKTTRGIVGRTRSNIAKGLTIDVHHINFDNLEIRKLYSKVIESENELRVISVGVQGDFVALLCIATDELHLDRESYVLTIGNFITDEIVHAKFPQAVHNQLRRPKITIIREHLFLLDHDQNTYTSLSMLDIRHLLTALPDRFRSPSINKPIDIGELGFSRMVYKNTPGTVLDEATVPSLCSFHWKEDRERIDTISLHFYLRPAHLGAESPGCSILLRYAFTPRKSKAKPPRLSLIEENAISPFVRSRPGASVTLHCISEHLPLSARAFMLRVSNEKAGNPKCDLAISTPIERADDVCSTFAVSSVPRNLKLRLDIHRYSVDHLSGAIITYTSTDERRIKIVYPA